MRHDEIERLLREQHRDQRKAIPRAPVGKVRPKTIRMPGDMIDKRRDPQYRAGPVYRYKLPATTPPEAKDAEAMVHWFKPRRSKMQPMDRHKLAVYLYGKRGARLRLSTALRNALAQKGDYLAIGLTIDGRLAVKAVTDPDDGWEIPFSVKETISPTSLFDILANHEGWHTMVWDNTLGCWVSTGVRPHQTNRRAKAD